eukprot:3039650-Amphidinium_carterae.1
MGSAAGTRSGENWEMGSSGRGRCELVAGKVRGRRGPRAGGNQRLRVTESCAWNGRTGAGRG